MENFKFLVLLLFQYFTTFGLCQDSVVINSGVEYQFYTQLTSQSQAEIFCRNNNATLVSVLNRATQALIMRQTYNIFIKSTFGLNLGAFVGGNGYWTSGYSSSTNLTSGIWRWADGSEIPNPSQTGLSSTRFSNWVQRTNPSGSCLLILDLVGKWSNVNCNYTHYYICQKKILMDTVQNTTASSISKINSTETSAIAPQGQLLPAMTGWIFIGISAALLIIAVVLAICLCRACRRLSLLKNNTNAQKKESDPENVQEGYNGKSEPVGFYLNPINVTAGENSTYVNSPVHEENIPEIYENSMAGNPRQFYEN